MSEVESIKHVNGGKMESYRCNTCSIEFNLVDELIEHTQVNHASTDVVVTCGRCQIVCDDVNEFLVHHRTAHDGDPSEQEQSIVLQDRLKDDVNHIHLEVSSQDSDIVNGENVTRITIVNDDGEAIGLASSGEDISVINTDQNTSSSGDVPTLTSPSTVTSTRKRRVPLKYRDHFLESPPNKRSLMSPVTLHNTHTNPRKEDIEIDITNLSSVRFKSSQNVFNKEILTYLQRVDEKLNCIIKHFNVPAATPQLADEKTSNKTSQCKKSNKHSDATESNGISTVTMTVPRRHATIRSNPISRQESITYISCEAPPQEITQYVISDDLLEATFMKSRNRGNFAKNLVYAAFPLEERLGRNCYGRRGGSLSGPKDPLESAKLDAVKEAVFKKFPVMDDDDEEAIWKRECVIAIDTALRSEMRTRIMNMQVPVKHDAKHELKHTLMNMPM